MSKSKVEVSVSYSGVGEMLRGSEMQGFLQELAGSVANKAGAGYGSDTALMGSRYIASAFTETRQAKKDNMENNTLLRCL